MEVEYDKEDQYKRVLAMVIPGEQLYAVLDCKGGGTGFVGITDLRLIFLDDSFVSKSRAVVSVPFSRVVAVGSKDDKSLAAKFSSLAAYFATSTLFVVAGVREWSFEFRTPEKAHKAYDLIMKNLLQAELKGM